MKNPLDRMVLLARLERVEYKPPKDKADDAVSQMGLTESLLTLAEIDQEREYVLCKSVALHLLGQVREPEGDDAS